MDIKDEKMKPPSMKLADDATYQMTGNEKTEYEKIAKTVDSNITKEEKDAVDNLVNNEVVNEKALHSWFAKQHDLINFTNRVKTRYLIDDIKKHLQTNPNAKIVVFSQHTAKGTGVDLIEQAIKPLADEGGFKYGRYYGKGSGQYGQNLSTPGPERALDAKRFVNSDAYKVMVSSDAGAIGINYPNATMVVNLDHLYNPQKQNQRTARAIRAGGGANRQVLVRNMAVAGTIDERIMQVQSSKEAIFKKTMNGVRLAMPSIEDNMTIGVGQLRLWQTQKFSKPVNKSIETSKKVMHIILID